MEHRENSRGFEHGNQVALENLLQKRETFVAAIKDILRTLDRGRADIERIAYQAPIQGEESEPKIFRLSDADVNRFDFAHKQSTVPGERLPQLYEELAALDGAIMDLKESARKKKDLLN